MCVEIAAPVVELNILSLTLNSGPERNLELLEKGGEPGVTHLPPQALRGRQQPQAQERASGHLAFAARLPAGSLRQPQDRHEKHIPPLSVVRSPELGSTRRKYYHGWE